jgi:uncharacterized protein (DUF2141 family)
MPSLSPLAPAAAAILVLISSFAAHAAPTVSLREIRVTVTAPPTMQGRIFARLACSQEAWQAMAGEQAVAQLREGRASLRFEVATNGPCAVRVFLDTDGDGRLSSNAFGLPKEPIGVSNNASMRFGPPRWSAARFDVRQDSPTAVSIALTAGPERSSQ